MKMKRILAMVLAVMMLAALFVGCGSSSSSSDSSSGSSTAGSGAESTPTYKGEITFIHFRTDLDGNGKMKEYIAKFNEKYPDVTVKTESMSDYDGEMTTRMNSNDYGDVLAIPDKINKADYPTYFEKLGSATDMETKYNWIRASKATLVEDVYGIPICGNAFGIVYNKKIWSEAGVSTLPKTPDEFINDLKLIKEKTKAIPFYTNYHADWTLAGQYEDHKLSVSANPDINSVISHDDAPWASGKPYYTVFKLLYDAVKNKLVEDDPMTSDWESSKTRLATGEIATMMLGSWAIKQCQERAVQSKVDPADVAFMPFPYTNADGNMYAGSGGDRNLAINIHSNKKDLARLWLDWFINESTFASDEGSISTVKGAPMPSTLQGFQDLGVKLIAYNPPKAGEETLFDDIDKKSSVGIWLSDYKKEIVEAALGTKKETFDDIMNKLNKKWAQARKDLKVSP